MSRHGGDLPRRVRCGGTAERRDRRPDGMALAHASQHVELPRNGRGPHPRRPPARTSHRLVRRRPPDQRPARRRQHGRLGPPRQRMEVRRGHDLPQRQGRLHFERRRPRRALRRAHLGRRLPLGPRHGPRPTRRHHRRRRVPPVLHRSARPLRPPGPRPHRPPDAPVRQRLARRREEHPHGPPVLRRHPPHLRARRMDRRRVARQTRRNRPGRGRRRRRFQRRLRHLRRTRRPQRLALLDVAPRRTRPRRHGLRVARRVDRRLARPG